MVQFDIIGMNSSTPDVATALGAWIQAPGPMYRRLARAMTRAIENGSIAASSLLPPERSLAEQLAISRSTVIAAYDVLRADGLVESRRGSGTRVCPRPSHILASGNSGPVEAVGGAQLPGVLAGATHVTDSVDLTAAAPAALSQLLADQLVASAEEIAPLLKQHGYAPAGLPALRYAVADYFTRQGVTTHPDQILITNGAQQGISLLSTIHLREGDAVLVENPSYFGALDAFRLLGARVIGVPMDHDGIRPEVLREKIEAARPRLIYLIPTYQNPTGSVLPESRRRQIADMIEALGIPLIEDLSLADIVLHGHPPAPIAQHTSSAALYTLGSLSKLCWPGLRIGWIRGTPEAIGELARAKAVADLGSPLMDQVVAARLMSRIDQMIDWRAKELTPRYEALAHHLARELPEWHWRRPNGGLYLWIKIPRGDTRTLAQRALRQGVRIIPGSVMSVDDSQSQCFRFPFVETPEVLAEAVGKLKQAWLEMESRPVLHVTSSQVLV